MSISHESDNISFLFRRNSASYYDFHVISTMKHQLHQTFIGINYVETLARENHSVPLSGLLIVHGVRTSYKLVADSPEGRPINDMLSDFVVK